MASDPFNIRGVILFSREFKEKDRILTVITADRGILSFCVKGAGSGKGKNSYTSVPFMLCDFVINSSGGFNYLKEGNIIESNSGIMNSLEAMAVAGHIGRVLSESILQSDNSAKAYELCVYAYYVLGINPDRYSEVYCAFNWKLLNDLGFASSYEISELKSEYYLSLRDSYYTDIKTEGLFRISASAVKVLDYFATHEPKEIFNVTLSDSLKDELRRFTTQYMQEQFEYEIKDPLKQLEIRLKG